MPTNDISTLVHLMGFITGAALYAMLGVMTLRGRTGVSDGTGAHRLKLRTVDRMAIATAALGVTWNLGGLVVYGIRDLARVTPPPSTIAIAFAALGFLPAVVIHAASRNLPHGRGARALIVMAYVLSAVAAGTQLEAALSTGLLPSRFGLRLLSGGYLALTGLLAVLTRRQPGWRRGLSAVALAAFAVMALHLSLHGAETDRWWVELIGHHASIPLAIAILYQDYRFALADLFLKRVLALVALLVLAFAAYFAIVVRLAVPRLSADPLDPRGVAMIISLWLLLSISYPLLSMGASKFVDRVVLRRADYRRVQSAISNEVADRETEDEVLDATCRLLSETLWVRHMSWTTSERISAERPSVSVASREGRQDATAIVATADRPAYQLEIAGMIGGRVLLSDDLRLLEAAATVAAHRINAIRLARERLEARVRENEILQLATEAELRALRAQLNPHFLFNALTTIGYLMRASPERALETLHRLTDLLRAVLRRSDGPFVTLAQEIEIVEAYLAIESARFEERLHVTLDVPPELAQVPVPSLILQPLVENAVKHGIAHRTEGGSVIVSAQLETADETGTGMLHLSVVDTGVGATAAVLKRRRANGIGLSIVERRLERQFGSSASLTVRSAPDVGTTVEIRLPVSRRQDARAAALEAAS